jgi:hypothetical protein
MTKHGLGAADAVSFMAEFPETWVGQFRYLLDGDKAARHLVGFSHHKRRARVGFITGGFDAERATSETGVHPWGNADENWNHALGRCMRAVAFHCGVLRRLADENLLERVVQLSTVSGGSLMMAAIVAPAANGWPTSVEYRDRIYAAARTLSRSRICLACGLSGSSGWCASMPSS